MTQSFYLTTEQSLPKVFPEIIQPFWQARVTELTFEGVDGVEIYAAYVIHPEAKGSIVVSGGRTEAGVKFKELFYDLYQNGYSVFTADHRGQGLSGRLTEDKERGYVDTFDNYVVDFKKFYDETVVPNSQSKPFLLCHSMGSAIGALYAMEHPDDFQKIVLGSPMFGVAAPIGPGVARVLINLLKWFNKGLSNLPWYFPGQGPFEFLAFDKNNIVQSEIRYDIHLNVFKDYPNTRLGGVTLDWLEKALIAMEKIRNNAAQITTPTLMIQAEGDTIIDNSTHRPACDAMPHCTFVSIPDARHELFMELDKYRTPTLEKALAFFAEK